MSHASAPGKRCHPRLFFGVTSWAMSIRKSPGFVVRTYSSYSRYNWDTSISHFKYLSFILWFHKTFTIDHFCSKKHGYIMFHPYDGSVKSWPKSQDLPACLFQLSATESASAVSGVPLLTMSSSVSLGTLGPQTPFQKEWDILRVWYHRIILKIHWIGWEICGVFFPIE